MTGLYGDEGGFFGVWFTPASFHDQGGHVLAGQERGTVFAGCADGYRVEAERARANTQTRAKDEVYVRSKAQRILRGCGTIREARHLQV